MRDPADRTFSARLDCHYLLLAPDVVDALDARTLLVVTLHGFGCNAETMMQLTARLFEDQPVIASLQGPNQFFLGVANRAVGYGWITSRRPAESIPKSGDATLPVFA